MSGAVFGALSRTGVTSVLYVSATVPPTPIDDQQDGYVIGTRWFDTVALAEYVLIDDTIGNAVWIGSGGTAGGQPTGPAGGDLNGTYPNPTVKQITPVSLTLNYSGGVLTSLSNAYGTKTFTYTGGVLTSITGTGIYKNKTFNYTSGTLTSVTVS